MKKICAILFIVLGTITASSQTLFDSFTDGNFTINPVWGGTTSAWIISPNSDAGPGAVGSNTLRLAAPATVGTEYLSSQVSDWGASQEWGFFIGRRGQAATAANQSFFWLYSNEANLNSSTVDGYRIAYGDDLAYDYIRLEYVVDGAVNSTVITSNGATTNGITDFSFLVRVTRSRTGAWEMYSSLLANTSGFGELATRIPNLNNTPFALGTGANNAIVPVANGYIGVAALHTADANAIVGLEIDHIHLTAFPVNTPTIIISPLVIDSFITLANTPTIAKSYVIEGIDLTSDIVVASGTYPNFDFEASLTNSPFVPTSFIYLTPVAGLVPPTTIYTRLYSNNMGLVGDYISNTSTGAVSKPVLCRGNVLEVPPTIPSTISFGTITNNSIVVNFTGGNGDQRLLLVKESAPVNANPPNGNIYGPYIFGTGIPLGAGNYPVYRGAGNSTVVTGLTAGRTYHFAIFEYNFSTNTIHGYGSEHYLLPGGVANATTFFNPLPITINYFNGAKNNGNHLLNWKVTCVSTPSATIEMERSTDGRNYSGIYSIFATALRCQEPFNYTDNQPAKGINYYRLKMTDADGKITYSTVVTLINAVKGIDVMNIAPNPIVNGTFILKVSTAEKIQMELVITDMQGRVLQKQTAGLIAGFNQVPMNVQNLAAGSYQLFGNTTDGRTRVLRFVVQ